MSLLIRFGEFRYFIGGDIEAATERKIADHDLALDVDVYAANHHGSDTSSDPAFIADLAPMVIIISNGNNATYKHPRQATLDALASLPNAPAVFQTNKYLKGGSGGNVADAFIADPETTDRTAPLRSLWTMRPERTGSVFNQARVAALRSSTQCPHLPSSSSNSCCPTRLEMTSSRMK